MQTAHSTQKRNPQCKKTTVVFFGSPMIDIIGKVEETFLRTYNLEADNTYWVDQTNVGVFSEVCGWLVQVGGSATNTARVFKKMSPNSNIVYFGSVGCDDLGQVVRNVLEDEGLNVCIKQLEELNTGKVAVLLCGDTRTLITDLGASQKFAMDDGMWSKITKSSYIYFSAFFIAVSYKILTRVCDRADLILAMNLGAPFLSNKFPKEMIRLYQGSNLVFGNEAEHRAFARINNLSVDNLQECVMATNQALNNESRVVVVTRGSGSVLVVRKCEWEEYEIAGLPTEKIIDTNGAGDAFAGGFLARFVAGDSIANCVRCGTHVARHVIQTVGFNVNFSNNI